MKKALNLLCAFIALALVVLQFTPYWHFGEDEAASIGGYIWMPADHANLSKYFDEALEEKVDVNNEIGTPILVLLMGVSAFGLVFWRPQTPLVFTCGLVQGVAGVIGYMRSPALRLGSLWGVHLGLSAAVLILGLAGIALLLRKQESGAALSVSTHA